MDQQPTSIIRMEHVEGVVMMLGRGIAGSVQVFLRSGYGDRALGVSHGLAAIFLFFYPLLWGPQHLPSVWAFMILYIIMLNIRRIGVVRRRWFKRGPEIHSRYDGRSCLHRIFPRASEWWIKQYAEPVLVFVVAMCMVKTFPAVATYLLIAAVIGGGEVGADRDRLRRQAQDMNDAMINQQISIEEFERLRRGRR